MPGATFVLFIHQRIILLNDLHCVAVQHLFVLQTHTIEGDVIQLSNMEIAHRLCFSSNTLLISTKGHHVLGHMGLYPVMYPRLSCWEN